ncbi:hypothetical protein NDU88_003918, partial [Pleurodeles waltl]
MAKTRGYNILRKQQSGQREINARRPRLPESKMATVTADRPARRDVEQKARSEKLCAQAGDSRAVAV